MQSQYFPKSRITTLIMKAIRHYERLLHGLRSHSNSFSTINTSLPSETLSDILLLLVEDHVTRYLSACSTGNQTVMHRYEWLPYTHVCRHWRMIALQCAPIWAFIIHKPHLTGHPLTDEVVHAMLDRSRRALLTVIVPEGRAEPQWTDLVLGEVDRIESLTHPCFYPPPLPEITMPALHNAPRLRSLQLIGRIHWSPAAGEVIRLPLLRKLHYSQFSFPTAAYLLQPTLTHLHLSNWSSNESQTTLLEAVRGLPLLHSLSLASDRWNPHAEHDEGRRVVVELHQLRKFVIHCTNQSKPWAEFMQYITFPSTTGFSFTSHYTKGSDQLEEILPVFSRMLLNRFERGQAWSTDPSLSSVASLTQVFHHAENLYLIQIWDGAAKPTPTADSNQSLAHLVTSSTPPLFAPPSFSLEFFWTWGLSVEQLKSFFHESFGTQVARVKTLFLQFGTYPHRSLNWPDAFQSFEHVETLYIGKCQGFAGVPPLTIDATDATIPFPKLKVLVHRWHETTHWQRYWKNLETALLSRRQHGCAVETIILLVDEDDTNPADILNTQAILRDVVTGTVVRHVLNSRDVAEHVVDDFLKRPGKLLQLIRRYEV